MNYARLKEAHLNILIRREKTGRERNGKIITRIAVGMK
jgi:hypothetical protein